MKKKPKVTSDALQILDAEIYDGRPERIADLKKATAADAVVRRKVMTAGEIAFEEYLTTHKISFEFEKDFVGRRKRPDYSIYFGREYLFEVKDFESGEALPSEPVSLDLYKRIRKRIEDGRLKFKEFEDWPCSLVLYNKSVALVDLMDCKTMLGAMYGDAGIAFEVNTDTGEASEPSQAFLGRGKMIQPRWSEPQNTTISAIISLRYVCPGRRRLERHFAEISLTRDLTFEDVQSTDNAQPEYKDKHLGVIVWENHFARFPFPRKLFQGPYDERYGILDGKLKRVFAGEKLVEYEKEFADGLQS